MVDKKEGSDEYLLVQVPTSHTPAIQTPAGEVMVMENALVEILNKLEEIRKAIA